jgi:hypothetical protein
MYAVISREEIQLPPGTVVRMPDTWQNYLTPWSWPLGRAVAARFSLCVSGWPDVARERFQWATCCRL